MTSTRFRIKVALGISIVATGLAAASVRFGDAARAGEPISAQAEPKNASEPTPNADFWKIDGVVVDDQGRPVAGATVRTMPVSEGPLKVEHRTAADGTFRFTLKTTGPSGLIGLMAEADDGARMGLDRLFDRRRAQRNTEPIRIVIKPGRRVMVRVKDSTGAPVPGATIEAAEMAFRTHAIAGTDGAATLRIPADAEVDCVVGFHPRSGFDYFESYEKRAQTAVHPLPDEVLLSLAAPQTVRIKAIDSNSQPVAGVLIRPARLYRTGKKDILQATLFSTVRAETDTLGIALFDWLPKAPGPTTFNINPAGTYSSADSLVYDPGGPMDLTARVRRATRLSGTVRFADQRPAVQVLVRANGWGQNGPARGMFELLRRMMMAGMPSMFLPRMPTSLPWSTITGRQIA